MANGEQVSLPVPEGMYAQGHELSYNKRGVLVVVIYIAHAALASEYKGWHIFGINFPHRLKH